MRKNPFKLFAILLIGSDCSEIWAMIRNAIAIRGGVVRCESKADWSAYLGNCCVSVLHIEQV